MKRYCSIIWKRHRSRLNMKQS